jgi:glycosyltransferase involved in cell wall biosynthesis
VDAVFRGVVGSSEKPFTFAFAGRQTQSKGFFDLLDVVRDMTLGGTMSSFRLLLIGDAPEEERGERTRRLAGLNGLVVDLGALENREDVLRALATSDAILLPSYREGLPLVLVEAMALGCPPIASNVGGIPELVSSGVSGIVIPAGDKEALMGSMEWALSHRDDLMKMGERAAATVRERFSINATVEAYLRIYRGEAVS